MNFKKIIYILFSTIFFIYILDAFALTTLDKGKILDNFKKLEYEMIFESDDIVLNKEDKKMLNTSKKMNLYNSIGNKIKTKREYLEEQSIKITSRVNSLKDAVSFLEDEIKETFDDVSRINKDVIFIKKQIEEGKENIEKLKLKVKNNKEVLLDYVIHLYKKSGTIYKNNDINNNIDNIKAILLSGEDIGDIINDIYFKSIIEVTGRKLVNKYKANIYKLYITNVNLEQQEGKIKKLRKSLMIKKKILNDKKEFKERLFKITRGKESLYKKYINEKLSLEKKIKLKEFKEKIKFNSTRKKLLKKYGCTFIDLSKNTLESRALTGKCLDINNIIYAESKLRGFGKISKNIFSWPVDDLNGISAYFHDKEYKKDFNSEHDAIDIVTPQGSNIYAPADGYVIYIQEPLNNGYAYIALKHSEGYVTLYGHINEILVKQYDFIKKGEVFAKSGGEYGTKGAGFLTTGPHLHFGVFNDKKYVDPLNYLDISYFSVNDLPDKYNYKFYLDFKNRKGYEYKRKKDKKGIFKIKGDTEVERQKNLLSKYAITAFNNWNMWVEEAIEGGIDPTFLMCIGLAESGLGNHLKTSYNVGNIGNTDSGSTYHFSNAREGVYWMVRTLNNKILGRYNHIKDLSRYGNKTGSIYASSSDNWHNNIIKCMSHIKGEYIEDNYNFRLSN